jgi:hypothetical protein
MVARSGDAGRSWRGGAPTPRPRSYAWRTEPVVGPRRARLALAVAAALCALAFVVLLFYLTPPPRPCFVAVATDPAADALRLDAPLDLFGRRSAERFARSAERWVRRDGRWAGHVAPGPVQLPADRAGVRQWARGFRAYDPVVMYLGLHGTTSDWYGPAPERDGPGPVEPVLHVGGGKRLPVRWLFEAVNESLPDRRVVILLDTGRLRPDPALGHLQDDFVERVGDVFREVRSPSGRLVVVCGSAPGQRGWESDELGATAFAHAAIGAFDEATGRADVRTVGELFDSAAERLSVWSANNRGATQTLVRFPPREEGAKRDRAGAIRVCRRPPEPPPPWEPVPLAPLDANREWLERWAAHDRLAGQAPHPAAYTPRLWRRYTALLLRYESAVRAGTPAVADRLAAALREAEGQLAHPLGQVFRPLAPEQADVRPPSFFQSLAFDAVVGPNPVDPTPSLWALATAPGADLPPAAGDPNARPMERHLAVMVQRFYRTVLSPETDVPTAWRAAIETRVRADRAALGLPPPGMPLIRANLWPGAAAAFSERVCPTAWDEVSTADADRRTVEDQLFAFATAPASVPNFGPATDRSAELRFAFHVRDRVFADLPYLGHWAVGVGRGDAVAPLWARAYKLDSLLRDRPGRDLAATTAEASHVWTDFGTLRRQFDDAVREQSRAALQKFLLPKEELLATPLLKAADRARLLTAARAASLSLLASATRPDPGTGPTTQAVPSSPAAEWVRLAVAELGLPDGGSETGVVPRVAAAYRARATVGTDERESRAAVAFRADDEPWREPAAEASRAQWAELLARLAARAVADHWYDEAPERGGRPYYARVASRYLEDARRLAGKPVGDVPRIGPLALAPDGTGPLFWTSERRRDLRFTLSVPAGTPPGRAVLLSAVGGSGVRVAPTAPESAAAQGRPLIPIRQDETGVEVSLVSDAEDELTASARLTVGAYYRGQRPGVERSVAITRRPELVVSDPGPPTAAAAVAIRADPSQPLRPVAVLLDYSGSMKEGLNGFRLPGAADAWKDGESKFNIALRRLEGVLAELPRNTPLRVRLFSARDADDEVLVYPKAGEPAVADWRGADDERLKDLVSRLRRYEPSGTTPLIRSIITAVRSDFPDGADGPRTLVVLTDGADDSGQPGTPKEVRDQLRAELKNALTATGVKLVVVQLALNDADRKISGELFADLPNLDVPGEVVSVDDAEGLRRELVAALWPKLVLTGATPGAGPNRYPPGGWPARPPVTRPATDPTGALDPGSLLWSPPLAPGTYSPRVAGYAARGLPKVELAPGDFLPLSLSRAADGFTLRRELHADTLGRGLQARRGDGEWALSVLPPGVEDAREAAALGAVTFLEKVPPHRLGLVAVEAPLRHAMPDALWWHVAPAAENAPAGVPVGRAGTQTVVTRLYGYPAPAWDVRSTGWPRTPGGATFEPATVRAWVPRSDPAPATLPPVRLPKPGAEAVVDAGRLTFRVSLEDQRFAGADGLVRCLVVRTEYLPGAPVQLRLSGAAPGVWTEHRYFRGANGYTAVFGPGAVPPEAADIQFQLFRVRDFVAEEAQIKLTTPVPTLGHRTDGYRPTPSKVGP